jgi:serine/threonine-protein kinase
MPPALHSLVGQRVDRYEVLAQLGQGGFGAVFRARHVILGTEVALKVLWPDRANDPTIVERFLREARAAASIGDAHVAQVGDAGATPEGWVFLTMELLTGRDLKSELATRGRLPPLEATDIARQALTGIAAAHRRGIVHRDLKPANVFLVPGPDGAPFVKVLDFGIAKALGSKSLTATGTALGTPQYMAPEQITSSAGVDARADVFAAGAMLYEMVAGCGPFEGGGVALLTRRMYGEAPRPLASVAPDVPEPLGRLIHRALMADRDARWPSADAMIEALLAFENGEEIEAAPVVTIPPGHRPETGPWGGGGGFVQMGGQGIPSDTQTPILKIDTTPAPRVSVPGAGSGIGPGNGTGPGPGPGIGIGTGGQGIAAHGHAASNAIPSTGSGLLVGAPSYPPRAPSHPPVGTQLLPESTPSPPHASWTPASPAASHPPMGTQLLPESTPSAPHASWTPAPPAPSYASLPVPTAAEPRIPPLLWAALGAMLVMLVIVATAVGFGLQHRYGRRADEPRAASPPVAPEVRRAEPEDPPFALPPIVLPGPTPPAPPATPAGSLPAGSPPGPDLGAIRHRIVSHTGMGPRTEVEAALVRARPALAGCARVGQPTHVAVDFIATTGGAITIAHASRDRPSDDASAAECAASAIQSAGPLAFTMWQTAIVTVEVDLPPG